MSQETAGQGVGNSADSRQVGRRGPWGLESVACPGEDSQKRGCILTTSTGAEQRERLLCGGRADGRQSKTHTQTPVSEV